MLTEEQLRVKEILQKTSSINQKLKDYTAAMQIDLTVKMGILKLPVTLEGQYWYKAPDRVKMELKRAPALLSKYPQIFGQRPLRPEDHRISVLPDDEVRGHKAWVLRFDKIDEGSDYRGQTVWIDQQRFTPLRHVYSYKENGRIAVDLIWRKQDDFWVLFEVDAEFDFPKHGAAASATAHYQDYKLNIGLDDAVFDPKAGGAAKPPAGAGQGGKP